MRSFWPAPHYLRAVQAQVAGKAAEQLLNVAATDLEADADAAALVQSAVDRMLDKDCCLRCAVDLIMWLPADCRVLRAAVHNAAKDPSQKSCCSASLQVLRAHPRTEPVCLHRMRTRPPSLTRCMPNGRDGGQWLDCCISTQWLDQSSNTKVHRMFGTRLRQ